MRYRLPRPDEPLRRRYDFPQRVVVSEGSADPAVVLLKFARFVEPWQRHRATANRWRAELLATLEAGGGRAETGELLKEAVDYVRSRIVPPGYLLRYERDNHRFVIEKEAPGEES